MVERRHRQLAETRGEATANLSMRVLRAVFNFAAGKYEDAKGRSFLPENPVKRLSATRAWYRVERRKTVIKAHQLPAWFAAVNALGLSTVRDFLLLLLFTGLRKSEAARLTWDRVDLTGRTLIVTGTKNHDDHVLPLPDYLLALLTRRKAERDALPEADRSRFVFPGDGETGYLIEPRKQIAHVIANSGVTFVMHDLRRSFITLAESLDIPAYALKRLLNHRMSGDKGAGVKASADVVDLARRIAEG